MQILKPFAWKSARTTAMTMIGDRSMPTSLKVAADLDNVPMARLLLEHGANVVQCNELDCATYSAIHAARSAEMVQLFLDYHADTN
jgi:ankyrin repeat protein